MKEPSVLDYLKSRLPWSKEKIEYPIGSGVSGEQESPAFTSDGAPPLNEDETREIAVKSRVPMTVPWRTFLALALALVGQSMLEPPTPILPLALGFYAFAFCLLLWAYFVNEFSLPALPEAQPEIDPETVRHTWIIAAMILAFAAFLFFGSNPFKTSASSDNSQFASFFFNENLFTPLNVTLWLLAIITFVRGIWLSDPDAPSIWTRLKNFLQHDSWQLNLTRWTLLILAVSAVIIFFRFYRLDGVPAEPFSDHAEKLLDVYDITQGQTHIFFRRNTGREFIQFYWTALIVYLLKTGLSFISLKIGTALLGLFTLPYIYLLGKEIGGKRVALFALILAGVAYWPNTISRIGLRFPLYPLFAAPVLFYLMRGLRTQKRNDFILCGLFLGLGLHGYSPFRIMPFVVVAALGLYLLHKQSQGKRQQVLMMLAVVVIASFLVFMPLLRYAISNPDMFSYRAMTRLVGTGQPLPAPALQVFLSNTFNAMMMFNWDDGNTWVHSIRHRPALDIAAAVLFAFGYILVFVRYLRQRRWQDIVLFVSVPLLMMPSILSLAFPVENPALNRTGGALVVVFVIAAMALDGLYTALQGVRAKGLRHEFALGAVIFLLGISAIQSYDLVFNQFDKQFRAEAWNSSDMGRIIRGFIDEGNSPDNVWVVPVAFWVDTRIVGIQSGLPTRDLALWRDHLPESLDKKGPKLFIVKDEDKETLAVLRNLYPYGLLGMFDSPIEGKDFWIYTVPDSLTMVP